MSLAAFSNPLGIFLRKYVMYYLIPSNNENLELTFKHKIIRLPKNLMNRYNLRRLKTGDFVYIYSTDDEKIYGIFRVTNECKDEKNPVAGPFNGGRKVDKYYYYCSVSVDCTGFFDVGVSVKDNKMNLKTIFRLEKDIARKIERQIRIVNKDFTPILLDLEYQSENESIKLLEIKSDLTIGDRRFHFSSGNFIFIEKYIKSLQTTILDDDFHSFYNSLYKMGSWIYKAFFDRMNYDFMFSDKGYLLKLIVDELIWKLPLEYAFNKQFLFENNVVTYGLKNQVTGKTFKINRILIFADPTSEYKWAYKEGLMLYNLFRDFKLKCDFISKNTTMVDFLSYFEQYDIIHLAGHYENGFKIGNEVFRIEELPQLVRLPGLIFLSHCGNGKDYGRRFLRNGAGNVIFLRWEIPDINNIKFITEFYSLILNGVHIGKALFYIKKQALKSKNIIPLLYTLAGNGNTKYEY